MSRLKLSTPSLSSARGRADQLSVLQMWPHGLEFDTWLVLTPGGEADPRAFNGNAAQLVRERLVRRIESDGAVLYLAEGGS